MDLRKETIKTEGCKPLLDAFQLVGISRRNWIPDNVRVYKLAYSVIYNLCIRSRDQKAKLMLELNSLAYCNEKNMADVVIKVQCSLVPINILMSLIESAGVMEDCQSLCNHR
jgi:hypothetical protein